MEPRYITDREGITYLMYAREYHRFDIRGVLLGFENDELGTLGRNFDNLEIDTRFCTLVNSSVKCDTSYINNILDYIHNNPDEIRVFLSDVLSDEEISCFLDGVCPSVAKLDIETAKRFPVGEWDDIPIYNDGTTRKRFFILNDWGYYKEVSLTTAVSIYGGNVVTEKCRILNYLNGLGMNGRAIWLNGLGVQDIDRDCICGGFCR